MTILSDLNIVLGVTGSISAYKSLTLASRLTQSGANVNVILTDGGSEFVTPLSFRAITQNHVVTDSFDIQYSALENCKYTNFQVFMHFFEYHKYSILTSI